MIIYRLFRVIMLAKCVVSIMTTGQVSNFFFLSPKRSWQFNDRKANIHFSRQMTEDNREMITETQGVTFPDTLSLSSTYALAEAPDINTLFQFCTIIASAILEIVICVQDIFEDLAADRKILSFTIKCPSRGCQWRGELREKNVGLIYRRFKMARRNFTINI